MRSGCGGKEVDNDSMERRRRLRPRPARESIQESIKDTEVSEHQLRKDLSAWDLTVFGIGVIIGDRDLRARRHSRPAARS
jgi:hypothetical protein